jgi:hypothetical protein
MARRDPSPEELAALKATMDGAELDLDNAKGGYFHGATYKDQEVTYDVLKQYAETYISKNYQYQKAAFGKVRVKLSVARLLRE